MRPARAFVLLLVAGVAVASTASAGEPEMKPEARAHYDAGMVHFDAQEWPAAIAEFKAGFAIDPQPAILFAQAQATRLGGDCPGALVLYRRFLKTNPPLAHAGAATKAMTPCDEAPLPTATPAPSPSPSPPLVVTPAAPERWYEDPATLGFFGSGTTAIVTGAILVDLAHSAEDDAVLAKSYDGYGGREDTANSRIIVGGTLLAIGGILTAIAIWRYRSLMHGP